MRDVNLALTGVPSLEEGLTAYGNEGVIYWEAAFEPARNLDEEIIGISYMITNITKRKVHEKKILAQNQSLLQIAHIHAHELRGPVTSIMGMMNVITSEEHCLPEIYIEMLNGSLHKLDSKIHEILDYVNEIEGVYSVVSHEVA